MIATSGLRSPEIFRRWAAITTIAGVLQRRVYTYTKENNRPLCPNLYTVLVGPPGSGKTIAVDQARDLWAKIKGLYIAPDNPTKSAFFQRLSTSTRLYMNGGDDLSIFNALVAPIAEFGVFIPKYDLEFISDLSHIWDNPDRYDKPRTSVESLNIDRPTFNFIAGVTPGFIGALFPEAAWEQGITSRFVFVYSSKSSYDNTNYFTKRKTVSLQALIPPLELLFELGGEYEWSEEAAAAHEIWLNKGMPGAPDHMRLRHWAERRNVHIMKLAMISAASAGRGLFVDIESYRRAHEWLAEAERFMPDVFRAITQKSDMQIIMDLHWHLWQFYARKEIAKRLPVDDELVYEFLSERVPSQNITKIIEVAERMGVIRRHHIVGPSGRPRWIPRPYNEHVRI